MNQPISRKDLRELKNKTDEINRVNAINSIVKYVYDNIIGIAKHQTITSYNLRLNYNDFINGKRDKSNKLEYYDFVKYSLYKNDLISGLKIFFPDCTINYNTTSLFGIEAEKQITCNEERDYIKLYKKSDVIYIDIDWS
jgi:hypothetical protein